MFDRSAFENSRPDGYAVLEVVGPAPAEMAGAGEAGEGFRRFVPLKLTEAGGDVVGPLATLRLRQTFGYRRDECAAVLEAAYRFPLPGDAAVTGVRVRFGDVEITATLEERAAAESTYAAARATGQQAALVTRESPDVFTLQVAGIRPDEEVVVDTTYVQRLRPEGDGWQLRFPLTTAPRYVRDDERGARPAAGQPLQLLRDPGHRFRLDLLVHDAAGETVASPTQAIVVTPDGEGSRVRLQGGAVLPDRDCVLTWQTRRAAGHPTLHVWGQEPYFLALVAPPATVDPQRTLPRETILLVDHSGSMSGPKWAAADWAVKQFLAGLTARDVFALGLFHNDTRWFAPSAGAPRPVPAGPATIAAAVEFLEAHRDSGGTELGVALEQALSLPRSSEQRARNVLVLTDAEVSDAGRILRLAQTESGRADRRRISVLCIDASPNAFLAAELAAQGGGISHFLTSNPDQADIATALDGVLLDWNQPLLSGMRLEVDRPAIEAASGESTASLAGAAGSWVDVGDLPAGRAVWVAGRLAPGNSSSSSSSTTTEGRAAEQLPTFRLTAAAGVTADGAGGIVAEGVAPAPGASLAGLKALFGARRVLGLEFLVGAGYDGDGLREGLRRLGYDPASVLGGRPDGQPAAQRLYAENTRQVATETLGRLLVREALAYGLASSETAFVAVRTERGQPVQGTVAVANALPAGWSERFLGGAAPASPLPAGPVMHSFNVGPLGAMAPARQGRAAGGAFAAKSAPFGPLPMETAAAGAVAIVFDGAPLLAAGRVVLYDSAGPAGAGSTAGPAGPAGPAGLPESCTLTLLRARREPGRADLPAGLVLLLYVDDLAAPRARVGLVDLIRQGGDRPLNLRRRRGERVQIVLEGPDGSWPTGTRLEVILGFS